MPNGTTDPLLLSMNLGRKDAQDFLRKLADDDGFRRRLGRNPQKALAEVGIVLPKGSLPEKVTLPPKEALRAEFEGGKPDLTRRPPPWGGCFIWGLAYLAAAGVKPEQRARARK